MAKKRKNPKQGTATIYRGIKYRSKWEVYVAKLLLYSDTRFLYEPRRFFLTASLSYLPDFYIPDRQVYLEVKGVLTPRDILLLKIFSESEKVIYLGKKQLSYIHGKAASALSKLDVVNYVPTKSEIRKFQDVLQYLQK